MIKQLLIGFLFFCMLSNVAYAVSDDFTVHMRVGDDTVPPTTPTILGAAPVAQTQIDLSWSTSTDDYVMGGYQVYRNSSQIATTTLTSYSDTGLVASTTYAYYVKAFDSVYNYSSSSNIVATTTLPITPTSTPVTATTTYGGNGTRPSLTWLSVDPSFYSASISWRTDKYAQFELRWGRTISYESGFVTSDLYTKENHTQITNLEPGTVYVYQLVGHGRNGEVAILKQGQFQTVHEPDVQAPANVSDLQATVDGDDVVLQWKNPTDPDLSHIRVVRNYLFYPTDPYDGYTLYQGTGERVRDHNALDTKGVQYYTVFSYDNNGNISSGAATFVRHSTGDHVSTQASTTASTTTSAPSSFALHFSDLQFVQDDAVIDPDKVAVSLPLTMRIPYDLLPEHLKSIVVTFSDPFDLSITHSYLLKIDQDKHFYQATIAPLQTSGVYPVQLLVYDFDTSILTTANGSIYAFKHSVVASGTHQRPNYFMPTLIGFSLLFLILLYVLYRLLREHIFQVRQVDAPKRYWSIPLVLLFCVVGVGVVYAYISLMQRGMLTLNSHVHTMAAASMSTFVDKGLSVGLAIMFLVVCLLGTIVYFKRK